jgi:hypothetical protein
MEKLTLNSIREKMKIVEKLNNLNFEFTIMNLKQNSYGKNDLVISQIKVTDENGKFIKFAQINSDLINALMNKGFVKIKNKL